MPCVSVHIVTYNSARTIESCLQSVMAQRGVDIQVCVIDNASTDDTLQRVHAFGVEIFVNTRNVGYAAAHNQAIDATTSDYVLTLNSDVWLDPGFVAALTEAVGPDSRIGSAAGCLLRVEQLGDSPTQIDSAGLFMRRSRRQSLRAEGRSASLRPTDSVAIFGPDGAAAFYRRTMLDDIRVQNEVFDSDFFMHKEDVDVAWRAQLRGWASLYVPGAIGHHIRTFRPGQRQGVSATMRFHGTRNRYLLMLKNESPAHFLRNLPWIAAYDLGILAYMLLRERETLAAFRSAWALRRRMIEKRRIIQARRRVGWADLSRWFR